MGPYAPINDPIRKGDRVLVKGKYKGNYEKYLRENDVMMTS